MITLQEVGDNSYPNFVYVVNDSKSKLISFINDFGMTTFKTPLPFSTRGRKFTVLKEELEGKVVLGSKGEKYVVSNGKCTCPGFKFRGDCKHVK